MSSSSPRDVVHNLAEAITAHDEQERQAQAFTLDWIASGAGLFRIQPPATPDPHLCVYAVLVDTAARKVLLADHVKAGAWLPPGGHVDDGESPREAVLREAGEELGIEAELHPEVGEDPFFLTVTQTRGAHSHTDVSFWFVLSGCEAMPLVRDPAEAHELRWFALDDPTEWTDPSRFDPGMLRFLDKLATHWEAPAPVA
ncbi:NUDIX domain-containing protein [Nocardia sp. NBC_00881]|uniref:NUDIX hydrolase n=1 Tax=Nocardia sp. NBC_00881 TaxID=2975995 RepID=UPI0038708FC3|nr:NUDIX domain-containing protein [Nocardia sp. NBC_00881]